jgi:hypothetical protein
MKLGVFKIPNTNENLLTLKVVDSDVLENNIPFICKSELDINEYDDISTIENWDNYGLSTKFENGYIVDYKVIRDEIGKLAFEKVQMNWNNWNNLTETEKDIVCKYVVCPKNLIMSRFPNDINNKLKSWDDESTKAREYRYNILIRNLLFGYLTERKALMCLRSVSENGLLFAYFGGLEGSVEDDGVEGLFDFILSREGTTYQNNGLKEKISQNDIISSSDTPETITQNIFNVLYRGY